MHLVAWDGRIRGGLERQPPVGSRACPARGHSSQGRHRWSPLRTRLARRPAGRQVGSALRPKERPAPRCVDRITALWDSLRDLPRTSADVMSHGDLTPLNVLVEAGRLVGVLDCGGFGPADPALELIAGWHLLDDAPRATFRAAPQCSDLEWERSKTWALEQSSGAVRYYARSNPAMSNMGRCTIHRILRILATDQEERSSALLARTRRTGAPRSQTWTT